MRTSCPAPGGHVSAIGRARSPGLAPSRASVFLVLVSASYGLEGYEPGFRDWLVRIVALDHESAEVGAIAFVGLQKPEGMKEGAVLMSADAVTVDRLGSVDCIAESVVRQ